MLSGDVPVILAIDLKMFGACQVVFRGIFPVLG